MAVGSDYLVFQSMQYIIQTLGKDAPWSTAVAMYYYCWFREDALPPTEVLDLVDLDSPCEDLNYPEIFSRFLLFDCSFYEVDDGRVDELTLAMSEKFPDSYLVKVRISMYGFFKNSEIDSTEDLLNEFRCGVLNDFFNSTTRVCPVSSLFIKSTLAAILYFAPEADQLFSSSELSALSDYIKNSYNDLTLLAPDSKEISYGYVLSEYLKKDAQLATLILKYQEHYRMVYLFVARFLL